MEHPLIVRVIASFTTLRSHNESETVLCGRCPLHQDAADILSSATAALQEELLVSLTWGRWHCFGACGAGGDAVDFLMRALNVSRAEAMQRLADWPEKGG